MVQTCDVLIAVNYYYYHVIVNYYYSTTTTASTVFYILHVIKGHVGVAQFMNLGNFDLLMLV